MFLFQGYAKQLRNKIRIKNCYNEQVVCCFRPVEHVFVSRLRKTIKKQTSEMKYIKNDSKHNEQTDAVKPKTCKDKLE